MFGGVQRGNPAVLVGGGWRECSGESESETCRASSPARFQDPRELVDGRACRAGNSAVKISKC